MLDAVVQLLAQGLIVLCLLALAKVVYSDLTGGKD